MKKIIGIFLILIISSVIVKSQNETILKKPVVDKRVELLCIVFRLADSWEYSSKMFPKYVESIETHFGKYKNHELIEYIKNDLRKYDISYDAVMSMAIDLTEPPNMKPIVKFSKDIPDSRWGIERATKFLKLLNQFYVDADCETFFSDNMRLYQMAEERFGEIYKSLDINWYQKFYGQKPKGEFRIVIGLGNGSFNYGPKIKLPDNQEIIYAIMGTSGVDSAGIPVYGEQDYFPTLLHEFNHSFVNHIVAKYENELKQSGEVIFSKREDIMKNQAYGNWLIMYDEAIVRAAVIKYMKDHRFDKSSINEELIEQEEKGFVWMDGLVKELERYDNNREQYLTFESFMPELVKFFNSTASNIDILIKNLEDKRPKIVSISPFDNNATDVDNTIKQILINFDRPLLGRGYSVGYGEKGKDVYPEIGEIYYSKDKKTVIMNVKLEPNREYQFVLLGYSFKSQNGYSIKKYIVNFKTKE